MPLSVIKPPALAQGDTIAILAPGNRPQGLGEVERACTLVERLGFRARLCFDPHSRHAAWVADDAGRAAACMQAWCDDEVRALWVIRGGWGAARLLPLLDYVRIAAHPKLLIACAEASALLVAITQRTGLATLHGPELADGLLSSFTRTWLLRLLTDPNAPGALPLLAGDAFDLANQPLALQPGTAEGQLLGGRLDELASLLGTPDAPSLQDRLLFAVLPNDPPYMLERHLTALRLAGLHTQFSGLALSSYAGPQTSGGSPTLTIEEALRYGVVGVDRPVCYGLPIAPGAHMAAMPLGVRARLDAGAGTLELLEGLVGPH